MIRIDIGGVIVDLNIEEEEIEIENIEKEWILKGELNEER